MDERWRGKEFSPRHVSDVAFANFLHAKTVEYCTRAAPLVDHGSPLEEVRHCAEWRNGGARGLYTKELTLKNK